jgi:hypothetical protein
LKAFDEIDAALLKDLKSVFSFLQETLEQNYFGKLNFGNTNFEPSKRQALPENVVKDIKGKIAFDSFASLVAYRETNCLNELQLIEISFDTNFRVFMNFLGFFIPELKFNCDVKEDSVSSFHICDLITLILSILRFIMSSLFSLLTEFNSLKLTVVFMMANTTLVAQRFYLIIVVRIF